MPLAQRKPDYSKFESRVPLSMKYSETCLERRLSIAPHPCAPSSISRIIFVQKNFTTGPVGRRNSKIAQVIFGQFLKHVDSMKGKRFAQALFEASTGRNIAIIQVARQRL